MSPLAEKSINGRKNSEDPNKYNSNTFPCNIYKQTCPVYYYHTHNIWRADHGPRFQD